MNIMQSRTWRDHVQDLTPEQREKLLDILLNFLLNSRDSCIGFCQAAPPEVPGEPARKESIYWKSCHESVLKEE